MNKRKPELNHQKIRSSKDVKRLKKRFREDGIGLVPISLDAVFEVRFGDDVDGLGQAMVTTGKVYNILPKHMDRILDNYYCNGVANLGGHLGLCYIHQWTATAFYGNSKDRHATYQLAMAMQTPGSRFNSPRTLAKCISNAAQEIADILIDSNLHPEITETILGILITVGNTALEHAEIKMEVIPDEECHD